MPRWALAVLGLAFVVSGATGLAYESLWSRTLGLFVGHAAYAQVLVLAVFLGGMSVGAFLVGRRKRLGAPLLGYAAVELASGVLGALFHPAYVRLTGFAHDTLFPALGPGLALTLCKWTLAALLVLPQSVLLGMTFPLMATAVLGARADRPGRFVALLYGLNSLGGAAGVLLAGFLALPHLGLPGALRLGALGNLVAGLLAAAVALVLGRTTRTRDALAASEPPLSPVQTSAPVSRTLELLLLAVAFGTALSSFFYEIAWTRMLSLVLGSATHAFDLMLSAFVLGLALGALWVRRHLDSLRAPLLALALVQGLMGLAALATLPVYLESFHWTARLIGLLVENDDGYRLFSLARYGVCLAVMLPATFFAGMTLPLITRALVVAGKSQRAVGLVYGWNTLGSILGALLAGLVLLPLLGLKGLAVAGGLLDLTLGVVLLHAQGRASGGRARRLVPLAAGGVLLTVALTAWATEFDRDILSSGVFRAGRLPPPGTREISFYGDGRTSTVSVTRERATGLITLSTNGKPDASLESFWFATTATPAPLRSIAGDQGTQLVQPLIGLGHAPHAKRVALIGHGSGLSSHFVLASPEVERVVTLEIEPLMVEGSRAFLPVNHRVFDDPRSTIVLDDARTWFAAGGERFDLIVSEPSNTWVSGVGSLFTVEFYAGLRKHLAAGGVLAQWLHLYEIDDDLVLSVLAAVHRNFASYELYLTSPHDLVIVASERALAAPDWSLTAWPLLAKDLRQIHPLRPWTLDAMWLASSATLGPLLEGWEARANSDDFPVLELGAERTRFLRREAAGFVRLSKARFDVLAPFTGRRRVPAPEPVAAVSGVPRVDALAWAEALRSRRPRADDADGAALALAQTSLWAFERVLAAGLAPPDWRAWFLEFMRLEALTHAGTAGHADEAFYGLARGYLERASAPPAARAAVSFLHGLAAWDFREAASAAEVLSPLALADQAWVPTELLLQGGLVADLCRGDAPSAARLLQALAKPSGLAQGDLRVRVMAALLHAALAHELPACPLTP